MSIFASPGMIAPLAIVLVVHALSLLLLALNVQIFRNQSRKYRLLLSQLGDQGAWGKPGRIIVPAYIFLVLGSTVVTILIFVLQPHVL